jgi:hypothetical protein
MYICLSRHRRVITVPGRIRALDHIHVGTARGFHSWGAAPRRCHYDEPAGAKRWAVGTMPVEPANAEGNGALNRQRMIPTNHRTYEGKRIRSSRPTPEELTTRNETLRSPWCIHDCQVVAARRGISEVERVNGMAAIASRGGK